MDDLKKYGAISPDQIIDEFEMRARIAELTACEEAARVWREAAEFLRRTEFVGWGARR